MKEILVISEYCADFIKVPKKYGIKNIDEVRFETPYGKIEGCYTWKNDDNYNIIYIPYAGKGLSLNLVDSGPAIGWLIKNSMIDQVIFYNIVGTLNSLLDVGDIVIVDDFLDETKCRIRSYLELEDKQVTYHYNSNNMFCERLRKALYESGKNITEKLQSNIFSSGVYICTEGPRYESVSEVKMYRSLGGDVVGHTLIPHVYTARELRVCFGSTCIVSNLGEGITKRTLNEKKHEFEDISNISELLSKYIIKTIEKLTTNEANECICRGDTNWISLPKKRSKNNNL